MALRFRPRPTPSMSAPRPASLGDADSWAEPQSDPLFDDDIPPAIACATCGLQNCEGCFKVQSAVSLSCLPWEADDAKAPLLETALFTVQHPDLTFGGVSPLHLSKALLFACAAELVAVGSFAVPWALGFLGVFFRLAMQMAQSPTVWLVSLVILLGLVVLVVLIHLLWGIVLEWAIGRCGTVARYDQGIRFGLYACGWDLVTSPFCFFVLLLRSGPSAAFSSLRSAAAAPRTSFNLYLERARGLDEMTAKSAGRLSVVVTSLLFFLGVCLGFGLLLWYLLSSNVYLI